MAYAVEMYFDSVTDRFVRETRQKLDDAGLGHSMLAAGFDSIFLTYAQKPWDYYWPNLWTPLCTLAIELEPMDINQAVQIVLRARLPLPVHVPEIGIIEVTRVGGEVLELIKLNN